MVSLRAELITQIDGVETPVTDVTPLPVSGDTSALSDLINDTANALPVTLVDATGVALTFDPAHDAADTGNPIKIGGKAIAAASAATRVASGDRTDASFDLDGFLLARGYSIADVVTGYATISDGSSTQVIAAQAANIAVLLLAVSVASSDADTGGYIELKDGTTAKYPIACPAAINSAGQAGALTTLGPGILGTAATAWNADPSAVIDAVRVGFIGVKVKV